MEHALPKEESMPVVSVLAKLFYHLPFPQYSGWHRELILSLFFVSYL